MKLLDLVNPVIISNVITQMVNFPARNFDCDPRSSALFNLIISPDPSICSTVAFPTLANFDHVVVSVSIDFPSNSFFIAQLTIVFVLIGMVFLII